MGRSPWTRRPAPAPSPSGRPPAHRRPPAPAATCSRSHDRRRYRVMRRSIPFVVATVLLATPPAPAQFNSGSTGADGALNPSANVTLALPPSGVFHFTTVNVPTGLTLPFPPHPPTTPTPPLPTRHP